MLDPRDCPGVRLLLRDCLDQFGAIAVPDQPQAQIGIFGHIMGIPAADLFNRRTPQEQRRSTQRHHQPKLLQTRQDDPEPHRIFQRKAAGQPIAVGIVVVENPLQASDLGSQLGKALHHFADLVGGGRIFGVIDADDGSLREIKRIVQRPRFGPQRPARHFDHLILGGQTDLIQSGPGQFVVILEDQADIEQFCRIVDHRQPGQQMPRDFAFPVQRHEH